MLLTFRLNAANDDDLDDNDAHILLNKPVRIRRTCTHLYDVNYVKTQVSCAKYDISYHWQHLSKAIFVYFTNSLINTPPSLPGVEIGYRHLRITWVESR